MSQPVPDAPRKRDKGRTWTPEQKAEQSRKMKEYWRTHKHPRDGVPTPPEVKEQLRKRMLARRVLGYCKRCELPLTTKRWADIGYGPGCLEVAIAEGLVEVDKFGQPVAKAA